MLVPVGDTAIRVVLGDRIDEAIAARVRGYVTELERHPPRGLVDLVPAFSSVTVFYDISRRMDFAGLQADLEAALVRADAGVVSVAARRHEIPVSYGGSFGPDLDEVAQRCGLSPADVVALHARGDYLVHAVGFTPGFPYLGGLAPKLATPRRATPRTEVAAGSVGIGGAQTGVYSVPSPAGWNIIGRTPLALFDPLRAEPALLRPGDRVTFRAIPLETFHEKAERERGVEACEGAAATAPAAAEEMTAGIEVRRAGMFTTVQDLGRPNFRGAGVPLGGAADAFALRMANLLVGNPETAGGLEFTLVGPELVFLHDTVVALTGAEFSDWPRWQPVRVRTGTRLELGAARSGCRGYLAIAGGIDAPVLLGSRSTQVRARFGGWQGRLLRDGDVLPVPHAFPHLAGRWRINERILPRYGAEPVLRVVAGAERSEFNDAFFTRAFTVSPQSDRMGVRLVGPALARGAQHELVSCAVAPGTIQVPPDGNPIVLLADAQTIGGYPQIAHVIAVDLPVAAQLRPGSSVRFQEVTLSEAHQLLVAREHALAMLREGLAQKLG